MPCLKGYFKDTGYDLCQASPGTGHGGHHPPAVLLPHLLHPPPQHLLLQPGVDVPGAIHPSSGTGRYCFDFMLLVLLSDTQIWNQNVTTYGKINHTRQSEIILPDTACYWLVTG